MTVSVELFNRMIGQSSALEAMCERNMIALTGSYSQFVDRLYRDIDRCIYDMQARRELLQNDSEDRLTAHMLALLVRDGYKASHDKKNGGHIDITVEIGAYSWIGEAKKDGNFREGLLQLTTRYVPGGGDYSQNEGGLIFYLVAQPDAAAKLRSWTQELMAAGAHSCVPCARNVLALFSEHTLPGPGTPYKVRSMCVSLYHSPLDRSGRRTAARAASVASDPTGSPTASARARTRSPKQAQAGQRKPGKGSRKTPGAG